MANFHSCSCASSGIAIQFCLLVNILYSHQCRLLVPFSIQVEDINQKEHNFIKNVKDVGLNPQDDLVDSPPPLSDVKKLQDGIIELWDVCNISLIHRTCFFLLFIKDGHPDTIYLEVERRRLSYIKDSFSLGKAVILDGRQLTPISRYDA